MRQLFLFLAIFLFSCDGESPNAPSNAVPLKLYVCDQGSNRVVILDASTDNLDSINVINIDLDDNVMMETPHFVLIDEVNEYWFVSTTEAGYIGMYDLNEDTYITKVFVGDMPALLAADKDNKKLYVSKMMEMDGMDGGLFNQLEVLSYSDTDEYGVPILEKLEPITVSITEDDFKQPHAISFVKGTSMGKSLITASMSHDVLARITSASSYISSTSTITHMGLDGEAPNQAPSNLLFPLDVTQKDDFIFFSCRGSISQSIKGQVQLWSLTNLNGPLDTYEFDVNSSLWHIVPSPVDNKIYVVLSGDGETESAGLACLSYSDTGELTQEWKKMDSSFDTLHGITVSADGSRIYVSSRGDGSVHVFSPSGELINTIVNVGNMNMGSGMGMSMGSLAGIAITQVQ